MFVLSIRNVKLYHLAKNKIYLIRFLSYMQKIWYKKVRENQTIFHGLLVEATGFEPTTSWSRTMRATNCATPRFCAPWKYTFHKKRIYYNKCNFKCQPFFMGLEKYFLKIFQAPFLFFFRKSFCRQSSRFYLFIFP